MCAKLWFVCVTQYDQEVVQMTTDLTPAEAIQAHERLSLDLKLAESKVSRPGKRPTAAEREENLRVRDEARAALRQFMAIVDPEAEARGMRLAREVRVEEEAILARLGIDVVEGVRL